MSNSNEGEQKPNVRKRVLFVDDEPMVVKVVESRLRSAGFEVITARNGKEGIAKAETQAPDIIVLDSMMPEMNGQETCARLKANEKTKRIPVVVFTCNLANELQNEFIAAGALGIIYKPDVKLLTSLLKDVLAGKKIEWGSEDGRW